MYNIQETTSFDTDVKGLATTDPLLGGPTGQLNAGLTNLANRTNWLKSKIGTQYKYNGIAVISGNTSINSSHAGKLIVIQATDNITLTLDAQVNFEANTLLHFVTVMVPNKTATIACAAGEQIQIGNNADTELCLMDGEYAKIVANSNVSGGIETGLWQIDSCSDSIYETGDCVSSYVQQHNTAIRGGQEVSRADLKRLWKWVSNKLTDGQQLVDDSTWFSTASITTPEGKVTVNKYMGCWSKGNGTTTFRIPDDRGVYDRYLDLGRGIDNDRLHNYAGGYEHDAIKAHSVDIPKSQTSTTQDGYGRVTTGNDNTEPAGITAAAVYSSNKAETMVKSNAKIPLIKL